VEPGGATLDVDGNGELVALTDGLLAVRYFFGFTGGALINNAVGAGCSRCSSSAIVGYLDGLGLAIDIDGNGSFGPLTDGLLVLRYLFGFTGNALISNAVEQPCARCDAASILAHLEPLD
jgi:hypothetical protein